MLHCLYMLLVVFIVYNHSECTTGLLYTVPFVTFNQISYENRAYCVTKCDKRDRCHRQYSTEPVDCVLILSQSTTIEKICKESVSHPFFIVTDMSCNYSVLVSVLRYYSYNSPFETWLFLELSGSSSSFSITVPQTETSINCHDNNGNCEQWYCTTIRERHT